MLAPSEAQRKITLGRVPPVKFCDDEIFSLQWLMKRFQHVRQKRSGAKFDRNYSLCHLPRELMLKSNMTFGRNLTQFA